MNRNEVLLSLGISDERFDEAMIALTHKQILYDNNNSKIVKNIEYFCEVGKCVLSILLKSFIYMNYSKESSVISNCSSSSKHIFCKKFFVYYNIAKLLICKADLINENIIYNIVNQFIGFLYLETSYENLKRIFNPIFDTNELVLFSDYTSVVTFLKGGAEFEEVSINGPSHNQEFEYELKCNEKVICAKGKSKKEAKNKCAELYCKKYVSNDQIMKILGIGKNRKKTYKQFIPTDYQKKQILRLSEVFSAKTSIIQTCLTHSSFSNSYNVTDNSSLRSIGSDVEQLYLIQYIYNKYSEISFEKIRSIVDYLHSNEQVYNTFINRYKIADIILMSAYGSEGALEQAYEDTIKAFMSISFFSSKKYEIYSTLNEIYDSYLNDVDLNYINPTTDLQKYFQHFKDSIINYTYKEINQNKFICYATIGAMDFISFQGYGKSKLAARKMVSQLVLKFINEQFEPFLLGEILINSANNKYIIKMLEYLLINFKKEFTNLYIKNDSCFGLIYLKTERISMFVENITRIFTGFKNFFPYEISETIIDLIIKEKNNQYVYINNANISVSILVNNIWEFFSKTDITNKMHYIFEEHFDEVMKKSREILKAQIIDNGLFIKNLTALDDELQLLAIKSKREALYYISQPSKEVLKYILSEPDIYGALMQTDSESLINSLVDIQIDEFNELININRSIDHIILEEKYFEIYIKSLFRMFQVKKFYIATGFAYSSGINLIRNEIDGLLSRRGELRLIIGSLQKYKEDGQVRNMDRNTAITLNELIDKGCKLKTFEEIFYHGKMYYFEADEISITIMGSTNLSKNAFHKNKELDCLFVYRDNKLNPFLSWYLSFWDNAVSLSKLDISKFSDSIFNDFNFDVDNTIKTLSLIDVKRQINIIPDEILKKRLTLWLEHNPTNIYDNISVSGSDYKVFEFNNGEMMVLESFLQGNSYFVFYDIGITDLLNNITNKTKSEIFEISGMEKRGYHVREALRLEVKIKSYFLK